MKFKYKNERERKLKKGAIIAGGAAAGIGLVAAGRKAGPKLVEMAKNEVYARADGRNKQIRKALADQGKIALASIEAHNKIGENFMNNDAQKIRYMAFVDELKKLAMIPGIPSSDKALSDKAKAGIDAARIKAGKQPIHGQASAAKIHQGPPMEVKKKKLTPKEAISAQRRKKSPLTGLGLMQ